MRNNSRGILTVEAALTYPLFLIVIVTILNLLNIFQTQAVMQQALQNTAHKVAEYGYAVKALNGFDWFNLNAETNEKIDTMQQSVTSMGDSMQSALTSASAGFSFENLGKIMDDFQKFGEDLDTFITTVESVEDREILDFLIFTLTDNGKDKFLEYVTIQALQDMKVDLSHISLEDMHFESQLFQEDSNYDITITVVYAYHNPFMIKLYDKVWLKQTVTVRPWIGGNGEGLSWEGR